MDDDGMMIFDPVDDRMLELSIGLQQVFINSIPLLFERPSVFVSGICHSPREALVKAARVSSATLDTFLSHFSREQALRPDLLHLPIPCRQGTDLAPQNCFHAPLPDCMPGSKELEESDAYACILPRLCLLSSFLPEAHDEAPDVGDHLPDIARYVFTFPVLCSRAFAKMVKRRDPMALLLLYHFYRASGKLLPRTSFWWAQKRVGMSEMLLKDWLYKRMQGHV